MIIMYTVCNSSTVGKRTSSEYFEITAVVVKCPVPVFGDAWFLGTWVLSLYEKEYFCSKLREGTRDVAMFSLLLGPVVQSNDIVS